MNERDWFKSSYSGHNGNCLEVAYRKSGRSANGQCVEAGTGSCGLVHVRDSKNPEAGQLSFAPADWQAFIGGLKRPGHR